MNDRDRIETLEETNRQLVQLLRPVGSFPMYWGLTGAEERLLAALTRSGELSIEAAAYAAGVDIDRPAPPTTIRQHVLRLRKKVSGRGITVQSSHGIGYYLDPVSLAAARNGFQGRVEK